jgi:hypothetical protein
MMSDAMSGVYSILCWVRFSQPYPWSHYLPLEDILTP